MRFFRWVRVVRWLVQTRYRRRTWKKATVILISHITAIVGCFVGCLVPHTHGTFYGSYRPVIDSHHPLEFVMFAPILFFPSSADTKGIHSLSSLPCLSQTGRRALDVFWQKHVHHRIWEPRRRRLPGRGHLPGGLGIGGWVGTLRGLCCLSSPPQPPDI